MNTDTTLTPTDSGRVRRVRRTAGFVLAGLAAAGAGLVAVPAIAGAQDDATTVEDAPGGPGTVLEELVADGVISQEQADAITEAFKEHRAETREARGAFDIDVVTELLGLTGDEIREALVGGQTLADLATEQGVAVEDLVDAIVTERQAMIDEKVDSGVLTAEQAARISEGLTERVTAMVNGERPEGPGFGHRHRHRFGPLPTGAEVPDTDA